MFNLTLLDHLRLTFSQISQRQKAHTIAAESNARWSRLLRGGEAFLMVGVSTSTIAAAFGQGRVFIIMAAVLATLALLMLVLHLTFDFEAAAHTHAANGAHLWRVRERYRSLLTDLQEGVVDVAEARVRRDRLIDEVGAILDNSETTPAADLTVADDEVAIPTSASSVPN